MHRKALAEKLDRPVPKGHEVHHIDGNINIWRKDNVVSLPKETHHKMTKYQKGMTPQEKRENTSKFLKKYGKRIWR